MGENFALPSKGSHQLLSGTAIFLINGKPLIVQLPSKIYFVKYFVEDNFFKNLPTAAALNLPYTKFLPSAPAPNFCPISPLGKKIKSFEII